MLPRVNYNEVPRFPDGTWKKGGFEQVIQNLASGYQRSLNTFWVTLMNPGNLPGEGEVDENVMIMREVPMFIRGSPHNP